MIVLDYWLHILCISLAVLATSNVHAAWKNHEFDVMGTRASVELWLEKGQNESALFNAVEVEMQRIEQLMSPYIARSELSAINRLNKNEKLLISNEMYEVIEKSLYFSDKTAGAFDISFASIGFLYNYRDKQQPNAEQIKNKLNLVDYHSIVLNKKADKKPSIHFLKTGMKIDLGGIAKGYAVDQSIKLLAQQGIEAAIVTAGGDSKILGNRGLDANTGELIPWVIGIQHPRSENKQALRLPLSDTAISTSGDYERFFMDGDKRVHHIIHPSTGESASAVVSATIIGAESIRCDALSTSVFVLGLEQGLKLINSLDGYDAIIIDTNGKVFYSAGLASQ